MTLPLTVGFLPLLDCAPLMVAAERGFAAAEGLELTLVRETSWATLRDRLIVGHFDAAHLLGPMTVASTLGIGHLRVPLIAPMALGLGGNAITVSAALWSALQHYGATAGADPARQGAALAAVVHARARAGESPLNLAMVYPFSAHNYELRYWLAACGIDPDADVTLVVIPPPFMADALSTGQIDGFCSGEPWNSLAVAGGAGRIALATSAIWRRAPEKVLGMRADWAASHAPEAAALVRAIYRAAEWCGLPESRPELLRLLAEARYIGVPADLLEPAITGRLVLEPGGAPHHLPEFLDYFAHDATFPWVSHALWFYTQMVRWKQVAASPAAAAAARATYRPDLYREALRPLGLAVPKADTKVEHADATLAASGDGPSAFFDARAFDPDDVEGYLKSQSPPS